MTLNVADFVTVLPWNYPSNEDNLARWISKDKFSKLVESTAHRAAVKLHDQNTASLLWGV